MMNTITEENYYKILGTTAKISQRRIKEKYIDAVKKNPPEVNPEQFEKIRKAYEILKDPIKRKQYDISRKYGGKLEPMLEKASYHVIKKEFKKAGKIYREILSIDPTNVSGQIGMMYTAIALNDLQEAFAIFNDLREKTDLLKEEAIEIEFVYSVFSKVLIQEEYLEEAYTVLEEALDKFSYHPFITQPLAVACLGLEKYDRALEVAENAIPSEENETIEDFEAYTTWLHIISQTDKWNVLSKAQTRFQKFLKKIGDEEDRVAVFYELMEEYEEAFEHKKYRAAEMFIDFAKVVANNKLDIKEKIKEVKKLVRVEKDFNRIFRDEAIFPLVLRNAVRWYFEDEFHPVVQHLESTFSPEVIKQLEEEEEYYAAGILLLKKKYPALYNEFKNKWDHLFEELTQYFNREMKRSLKKLQI